MKTNFDIDLVLSSYLETLIWSSVDFETESFDGLGIYDFAKDARAKCKSDIEKFISLVDVNPLAVSEAIQYDNNMFGHNFALSRNGHGAGFFDDYSDVLQQICRDFGGAEIYVWRKKIRLY